MPRETEVKLRVRELAAVRELLRRAGASLARERHFEDNLLFDDAAGSLRSQGTALRVRRTPGRGQLTFKGRRQVQAGIKSRLERETTVGDPDELEAILRQLGYRPIFRYQKYRESWRHRGQAVELDETPVGSFVEIEGDEAGIAAVARELGYGPADYVGDSYVALFFASGGEGDMVFGEAESPGT